jgi:hypothetical protein
LISEEAQKQQPTNGQVKKKHAIFEDDDVFPVRNFLKFENKFFCLFLFRIIHQNQQIQNRIRKQRQQQQIKQVQADKRVVLLELYSIVLDGKDQHKHIYLMIKIKQ